MAAPGLAPPTTDQPSRVVVKPGTAAEMLDCARSHVYELMARGQLRKLKIGGMTRIPVEDIYRLVNLEVPSERPSRRRRSTPEND